jgi:hypothetical protein
MDIVIMVVKQAVMVSCVGINVVPLVEMSVTEKLVILVFYITTLTAFVL